MERETTRDCERIQIESEVGKSENVYQIAEFYNFII